MIGSFVLIMREKLLLFAGIKICALRRCYALLGVQILPIFKNGCISAWMEMKLGALTCLWKYEQGIFPIFLHCFFPPRAYKYLTKSAWTVCGHCGGRVGERL